eukprot:TRINITY_DN879_c0_g1_i8.p3 TRINITY_DN879_c0_g1~~TRINITY_DN879_c0_g1_i8.p3  ORF type:complete len:145 (+),score=43.21 TRINITY_DN879_c0_g1_i8:77-511(+)
MCIRDRTYTAQELSKMKRNGFVDTENDQSATHRPPRPTARELPGEVEEEPENNQCIGNKKSDHSVLYKSTSRAVGDKARAKSRGSSCSRSPGLINGTNRKKVLTENDLLNAKVLKTTVGKTEATVLTKKYVPGDVKVEEEVASN